MTAFDFSPLLRSTIGFERLMNTFDRAMRSEEVGDHYPPCNIVKTGDQTYRIEMAVAGFCEHDLAVEAKGDELVITGEHSEKEQEQGRSFLHRGIAARQFRRAFRLAEHVNVAGARLENGLLTVELVREVPEALKPRRIEIAGSGSGAPRMVAAA